MYYKVLNTHQYNIEYLECTEYTEFENKNVLSWQWKLSTDNS